MKISNLLVATLFATTLFGENLVKNGSFEQFDKEVKSWKYVHFDSWDGEGEVWTNKMGRAAINGSHKIEIDARSKTVDSLSQTITTQEGTTYLFRVDAYARKEGSSDFELLVDGDVIAKITPGKDWLKYGATFVGKGGEQTISIREVADQNDGYGAIIDNVVVQSDITSVDVLNMQDRQKYEILDPWGLDQIAEIIDNDKKLHVKKSENTIQAAKEAALKMNSYIKEAIKVKGLANDGVLTGSDAREISDYISNKYADEWRDLKNTWLKIRKYTQIKALGKNAVKHVWSPLYNIGFPAYTKERYSTNVNGNRSLSFETLGYFLNSIVDIDANKNPDYQEIKGETGTSLDKIVNVILNDRGLNRYIPKSDLREGARCANEMNKLLVKAIKDTAVANDGIITTADVRTLNNYLVKNYEEEWAELHGDDEDDYETGYHRVQNDGATTRMFGRNVMNTIADGIYHLGYKTDLKNRLVNEDGNANQTFEDVAWWLDVSLKKDIKAGKLSNPEYKEIVGTTGTSLDQIIPAIFGDEGLIRKVSTDDMRVAAANANKMNELLIEAIKETGVAEDRYFSIEDIKAINKYLVENYADEWAELHGDDEEDSETGFHRIQNDGAVSKIEGHNLINTVADGIYHLGYKTKYANNLVNEDGNKNVTFYSVAYWLNKYMQKDLQNGSLVK